MSSSRILGNEKITYTLQDQILDNSITNNFDQSPLENMQPSTGSRKLDKFGVQWALSKIRESISDVGKRRLLDFTSHFYMYVSHWSFDCTCISSLPFLWLGEWRGASMITASSLGLCCLKSRSQGRKVHGPKVFYLLDSI